MSSRDSRGRIRDILDQIARVEDHIGAMTFEAFAADIRTQDAIERCLERICEAVRKIGPGLDDKYPDADFPNLRKFRSVLRHDYDDLDVEIIWTAVVRHLPRLKAACRDEIGP